MTDVKVQHILTLAHLMSLGARYNFVPITTRELGLATNRSQQAASNHILELEKNHLVQRISCGRNYSVKITQKGYDEMTAIYNTLDSSMSQYPDQLILKGRLVSGMGEGAYYMSMPGYARQFEDRIGYVPFPGTLNVKLEKKEFIESAKLLDIMDGIRIDGFSDGKRTFGWVKCFNATLNSVDANLIRLERTHHDPFIVELISRHNIRRRASISNGSSVTVAIDIR